MVLQLTNNEWLLRLDTEIDSSLGRYLLGNFRNPFVILNFTSESANPLWTKAGYISQAVIIDNSSAYDQNREVLLNLNNFCKFEALSGSDYRLYYFPPTRLQKVRVKVWEYQGTIADSSISDLIDSLSKVPTNQLVDLSIIEEKLEYLLAMSQVSFNSDLSTNTNFFVTRFT